MIDSMLQPRIALLQQLAFREAIDGAPNGRYINDATWSGVISATGSFNDF